MTSDALDNARRSADVAYSAALGENARELQRKLSALRSNLASRGLLTSSVMTGEAARIYGEYVRNLLQARLDGLLDGYELHDLPLVDDALVKSTVEQIVEMKGVLFDDVKRRATTIDIGLGGDLFYQRLDIECGVTGVWITARIDQRRLMTKRKSQSAAPTVYHVHGHNSRVNVNSVDNSVNVITVSPQEIFANLRQAIQTGVPEGEQEAILARLEALEREQHSPTFAQRYTEFISTVADHMKIIGPFIPALTELLQKTLSSTS